jgi:plastocyanin
MSRLLLSYLLIGLAVATMAASGCSNNSMSGPYGGGPPPPARTPANTFVLSNLRFNPTSMTVPVGTTITWQNDDATVHTSTSDTPGLWDTGNISAGSSKTTKFNTAGTFTFHCIYHVSMGMTGSITVR